VTSRFAPRIVTLPALALATALALVATATTVSATQPLNGLFRVATGSYFRMIYPGGGKYFEAVARTSIRAYSCGNGSRLHI
jgi:hypothetical protein